LVEAKRRRMRWRWIDWVDEMDEVLSVTCLRDQRSGVTGFKRGVGENVKYFVDSFAAACGSFNSKTIYKKIVQPISPPVRCGIPSKYDNV
jgi:hypothetical protein